MTNATKSPSAEPTSPGEDLQPQSLQHQINLRVVLVFHATQTDLENTHQYYEDGDAIAFEIFKLNEDFVERVRAVMAGEEPPEVLNKFANPPFNMHPDILENFALLHASGKVPLFVDLDIRHPALAIKKNAHTKMLDSQKELACGTLEEAVKDYRQSLTFEADYQTQRSAYITAELRRQLRALALPLDRPVEVVFPVGNFHRNMDFDMGEGVNVEIIDATPTRLPIIRDQLLQAHMEGVEQPDELYARELLSPHLFKYLFQFSDQTNQLIDVTTYLLQQLAYTDIEEIQQQARFHQAFLRLGDQAYHNAMRRFQQAIVGGIVKKIGTKNFPFSEAEFEHIYERLKH